MAEIKYIINLLRLPWLVGSVVNVPSFCSYRTLSEFKALFIVRFTNIIFSVHLFIYVLLLPHF